MRGTHELRVLYNACGDFESRGVAFAGQVVVWNCNMEGGQ